MIENAPDPADISDDPVLVLSAYLKTDEFAQIVGGHHFVAKVEAFDCSEMSALVILAQSLGDVARQTLGGIDCTGNPTKESNKANLLKVLTLPAETLEYGMTAQFMRTNDTQEDQ